MHEGYGLVYVQTQNPTIRVFALLHTPGADALESAVGRSLPKLVRLVACAAENKKGGGGEA
jgi:hypothetical protein